MEDSGEPQVEACFGMTRLMGKKKPKLPNAEVERLALDAAVIMSGISMQAINNMITDMLFYEIRNTAYIKDDFQAIPFTHKLFTEFTEAQLALWLHDVIVFLHRLRSVRLQKAEESDERFVTMSVTNTYFRDFFIFLLRCFGCRVTARYRKDCTQLRVTASMLSDLLAFLFSLRIKPLAASIAMYRKFLPTEYIRLQADGTAKFVRAVDTFHGACVEKVETRPIPVLVRAISFPELDNFYLENNLLRVSL